jgi:hypothetical protein
MLDNDKLLRRFKKIIKYLKERWGITPYRIAVEANIPHSSLKYMMDGKFEWKLNHLLSFVDFLNRNNAKISLTELLDFTDKKSLNDILNFENADFRPVLYGDKEGFKQFINPVESKPQKEKPVDSKTEADILTQDLVEVIKENPLYKNYQISFEINISNKNFDFKKDLKFGYGKKLKD